MSDKESCMVGVSSEVLPVLADITCMLSHVDR
jgi:hypothetical protein